MSRADAFLGSRRVLQVAALASISVGVAGCSADMSSRVQTPFTYQPEATGSVSAPAPQAQVQRQELPQYSRPAYQSSALPPPAVAAPQTYPVASNGGVSGGGRGLSSYSPPPASYSPPPKPQLEATATVPPRSVAAAHPVEPPPAASAHPAGTTIIVGTSDTLEVLSQRYHVSSEAILAANNYKGPRRLSPGQPLIIPHPTATAAAPAAVAPAAKPVAAALAPPSVHIVNPGETLASIAHHSHVSVGELAKANNIDAGAKLKLGTRLTVPGPKGVATAAPAAAPVPAVATLPVANAKVATAAPQQTAHLAQATSLPADETAPVAPVKASEAT